MEPEQIIAQRYRLGRKLGEGGMGTVYEAEHVITGRRLAVKILERRDKLPKEAVDRFLREARAPAAIGHPNIVEVIDAGTEPDGTPFIAMELLEGRTLDEVIKADGVVQPATLAPILAQLLDGLDAMHSRGFVHRDLKPANIFLVPTASGGVRVKLLDFGIAKALGEEGRTRSGYVIGTPAYMAPEQMRNARAATPRSDLWSVGVILHEALVGYRPFRGETFGLLAQISGPYVQPSLTLVATHLPDELARFVDSLLAKDPAQRPTSAVEVRDTLVPMLAAAPPVHRLDPPDDDASEAAPPESASAARSDHAPTQRSARSTGSRRAEPSWRDDDLPLPIAAATPERNESAAIPLARRRASSGLVILAVLGALIAIGVVISVSRTPRAGARPARPIDPANSAAISTALSSNAELATLLQRWLGTITATQGQGSMAPFYTDPVRFRGTGGLSSPGAVQRYWAQLFTAGGSFAVDWDRSQWGEESPDLNTVSAMCVNAPGATGRVIKVRAWATEMMHDRIAAIGCQRLEGVYLIRLRRVAGALRICHETWSLREGICASCPAAAVCQGPAMHAQ